AATPILSNVARERIHGSTWWRAVSTVLPGGHSRALLLATGRYRQFWMRSVRTTGQLSRSCDAAFRSLHLLRCTSLLLTPSGLRRASMRRRAVRMAASGSGPGKARRSSACHLTNTDERSLAHELREGLRELNYIEGPAATLLALGWMFWLWWKTLSGSYVV